MATRVAVVTGGHSFDVPNFHTLFRELPEIDAYVQHMDDFAASKEDVRDSYDCVVFYTMLKAGPTDEGYEWYQGKPLTALRRLGQNGQGIVILHHALLAYPEWEPWRKMAGIDDAEFEYDMDQEVSVHVSDPDHPITKGLSDWRITDETYLMKKATGDSHIILTTDHPRCIPTLAWTRSYEKSRVFCFQSGHDAKAWNNDNFRLVLSRGIIWAAGR